MARNDDVVCLICEEVPCGCNKPKGASPRRAAPKASVLKPEPQAKPTAPARPSFLDRMRRDSSAAAAAKARDRLVDQVRPPTSADKRFTQKMTDEEAALLSAVRCLSEAFEIHPDDLAPFQDRLNRPPSVEERSGAWRYRRDGV